MKKKISLILLLLIFTNLMIISIVQASSQDCNKVTNNLAYFNASLYDYNVVEFNERARNKNIDEFLQIGSYQEKYNIDSKLTLLGQMGYVADYWYKGKNSIFGGYQNGTKLDEDGNPVPYSNSGIYQGLVNKKLVNNNIALTYPNQNDTVFFPTTEQAESKNLVGDNKPYQKILRNQKVPFIIEPSGYYLMDSAKYHWKKGSNDKFELHSRNCWRNFTMEYTI